jgi:hypothetical protein
MMMRRKNWRIESLRDTSKVEAASSDPNLKSCEMTSQTGSVLM